MNRRRISTFCRLIGVAALLGVAGSGQADQHAMIEDALSAAPPTLRDSATVVDWDGNVLRQGSANYTCYPTPSQLEGTAPMCMDGPWMKWADAWNNKKALTISNLGISYMLAGDEGASNIDPYAAQMKTLQLVIEVSSPSTARHDRFTKRRLYQEQRISLYWIVDADSATIEVWRPELQFPEIERERVSWRPTEADTALTIELSDLLKPL